MSELSEEVLSTADDSCCGTEAETIPEAALSDDDEDDAEAEETRKEVPDAAARAPVAEVTAEIAASGGEEEQSRRAAIRAAADTTHTCRVCYDDYHVSRNQARLLGCGHSFCTRCVLACSATNVQDVAGIVCPECRQVSKQAPASLPINFQLMQLLTALSLVKEVKTPEQEKDLPHFENFDRLGQLLPVNELTELSMNDLHEHAKVVFSVIRQKMYASRHENLPKPPNLWHFDREELARCAREIGNMNLNYFLEFNEFLDSEIKKIEAMEKDLEKSIKSYDRVKNGAEPRKVMAERTTTMPTMELANDWMREMVVFRQENNEHIHIPVRPIYPRPVRELDVEDVLQQELWAREEADPRRNLDVVREAHFRRERNAAASRQAAQRNAELLERLRQRAEEDGERIVDVGHPDIAEEDEEGDDEEEDVQEAFSDSDDSSFIDEDDGLPLPCMTRGEAVTVLRLIERCHRNGPSRVLPEVPRSERDLNHYINTHIMAEGVDLTEPVTRELAREVQDFASSHRTVPALMLEVLREHSLKYAPNLVDAPRVIGRFRRRRRPALGDDDENATMTIIRKRAKQALRGIGPEQPRDESENSLTVRLIVNIANQMGVRGRLEHLIRTTELRPPPPPLDLTPTLAGYDPERLREQPDVFVPSTVGTNMLYCKACQCNLPAASREMHTQGRRHSLRIDCDSPHHYRRRRNNQ